MTTTDDAIYEEWIAYPRRREYVLLSKHDEWARNQGWWVSGWRGTNPPLHRRNLARPDEEEPLDAA